jgi:hypothetical protein
MLQGTVSSDGKSRGTRTASDLDCAKPGQVYARYNKLIVSTGTF